VNREFAQMINEKILAREKFAVATVVEVVGSSSAKPGSKALISSEGYNCMGWVGGGCAESHIVREAQKCIV